MDTPDNNEASEDTELSCNALKVKPLPTKKSDLPQSEYMKSDVINRFPSLLLIVGRSASGKSTVANYICTTPEFYGGFFQDIYLFSPTAEHDDLTKHLKIPKKNMITTPTPERLDEIIGSQDRKIKDKGIAWVGEHSRVLVILDDIVSHRKFLESPPMLKLACMGRHSLISSIINVQSYTRCPRPIRLQSNGLILFPSSQSEVNLLVDDYCPPNRSKKQFRALVEHATNVRFSFLYINMFCPPAAEQRYRKNFETYLSID